MILHVVGSMAVSLLWAFSSPDKTVCAFVVWEVGVNVTARSTLLPGVFPPHPPVNPYPCAPLQQTVVDQKHQWFLCLDSADPREPSQWGPFTAFSTAAHTPSEYIFLVASGTCFLNFPPVLLVSLSPFPLRVHLSLPVPSLPYSW